MVMVPGRELGEEEKKVFAEKRYRTYVAYAKRFEKLLETCREQIAAEKRGELV